MQRLINRTVAAFIKGGVIGDEDADTYRYGLDLLFSSLVNVLSILLLGFAVGRLNEAALLLLFYIPLQSFGGGYHANTHIRCFAITLAAMAASVCVVALAPLPWLLGLAIPALATLFRFAPVEHENAPFSASFAAKMKRIVRCMSLLFIICAYGFQASHPLIASCLATSLIMSALSLGAAHIKNSRTSR